MILISFLSSLMIREKRRNGRLTTLLEKYGEKLSGVKSIPTTEMPVANGIEINLVGRLFDRKGESGKEREFGKRDMYNGAKKEGKDQVVAYLRTYTRIERIERVYIYIYIYMYIVEREKERARFLAGHDDAWCDEDEDACALYGLRKSG